MSLTSPIPVTDSPVLCSTFCHGIYSPDSWFINSSPISSVFSSLHPDNSAPRRMTFSRASTTALFAASLSILVALAAPNPESYGAVSVVPTTYDTRSMGNPSSSATICRIAVYVPDPCSKIDVCTVPCWSGWMVTAA